MRLDVGIAKLYKPTVSFDRHATVRNVNNCIMAFLAALFALD